MEDEAAIQKGAGAANTQEHASGAMATPLQKSSATLDEMIDSGLKNAEAAGVAASGPTKELKRQSISLKRQSISLEEAAGEMHLNNNSAGEDSTVSAPGRPGSVRIPQVATLSVPREKYCPGTTLDEDQFVKELHMSSHISKGVTDGVLKSPEYVAAYEGILGLSERLKLGLKGVQLQVAEHPESLTRSEYNKEVGAQSIDIVVHLPLGQGSSLSAFTLFQTLSDTVDDVIKAALRKYRALGIALQPEDAQRTVIKIVGTKDYLLHKKVPIGYYQALLNAKRLNEQLHISLMTLEDDALEALRPLLDESTSSMVKSLRVRGLLSFQGVTPKAKLLDEIFSLGKTASQETLFLDMEEPAPAPSSSATEEVKSAFDKPLFISVDSVIFHTPFGYLHYYESFRVEVCLYFNDELLFGPFLTDTVASKDYLPQCDSGLAVQMQVRCGAIDTGLPVSSLPDTTRATFRLLGNHSSKSHVGLKAYLTPQKHDAIAGAAYTLVNTSHLIPIDQQQLGLLLFNDGEGARSWRFKDKYKLLSEGDLLASVVPESVRVSSINDLPKAPKISDQRDADDDHDPQFTLIRDMQLRSCVPPGGDINADIRINFRLNEPHGITLRSRPPSKRELQQVFDGMSTSINKNLPSKEERLVLEKIEFAEPISELTMVERDLLWRCRDYCSNISELLPKFLRAVPWRDEKKVENAHVLLYMWSPVRPSDALELLDVRYSDQLVREYAVDKLDELNDEALDVLLLQLVQVLKYEPYHDSALARFLVRRSLLSPLLIGQHIYWMLKSEMYMVAYRERFGLLLEVFLRQCGVYKEGLRLQAYMNDEMCHIAEAIKEVSSSKRTAALRSHLDGLNSRLPKKFSFPLDNRKECRRFIVDKCKVMGSKKAPLWLVLENADPAAEPYFTMFKCGDDLRQDQLTLQVLSIMDQLWRDGSGEFVETSVTDAAESSSTRSSNVSLGSVGKLSSSSSRNLVGVGVGSGPGNDTHGGGSGRSGQTASPIAERPSSTGKKSVLNTLSSLFHRPSFPHEKPGAASGGKRLRRESSRSIIGQEYVRPFNFHMMIYGCRSTGYNTGMIEIVMNSTTLASIHKQYGGLLGAFKPDTIVQYLKENNPSNKYDEVVDNFAKTCAAYCVGTYILGLGDRHSDNIMVDKTGHLFHIDFGHFLGNFKSKLGVKRERSPFVFLPEMAYVLRERETKTRGDGGDVKHYDNFESMSCGAYNLLRRRANLLINLFALMIPASMPELTSRADLEYFLDMLSLTLTEEQAKDKFKTATKHTLTDTFRKVDNFLHMIKHH